jgi:ubiquitin-protein ligase
MIGSTAKQQVVEQRNGPSTRPKSTNGDSSTNGVATSKKVREHVRLRMPQIPMPAEESLMKQTLKEKLPPAPPQPANDFLDTYGSFFQEHSIMAEFNHLKKTRLPGVYVIPSYFNPLVWFGVVFIRQGIYQDGVFRFTLDIPKNYPDGDCPSITFHPAVYHPFVDPTSGKLDLARGFDSWRANVNHIWQILLYMRRIFYKFDTNNPVNGQAASLYDSDVNAYKKKVREYIASQNKNLYEETDSDDPHAVKYREWDKEIHEKCKEFFSNKFEDEPSVQEDDFKKPKLSGLSFLEPGTSTVFSKR